MVAGVAAGLADWLGVDPIVVRIAFVVLTLSSGIGIVLYGLCWLAIPEEGKDSVELPRFLTAHRGRSVRDVRRLGALGLVLLGGLLFLRDSGLWVGDRVVWPAVLAAIGLVVIWRQVEGARWKTRAGLGILFVAGGVGLFLAANVNLTSVRQGVLATAAIVAGLLLIFGPWWLRLTRDLMDERRQRIRSDERADVATRVHDSVLQTLALIQRNSTHPREVVRLARHQERELRSWLFPDSAAAPPGTLKGALDAVGAEVEDLHGVPVEVIAVGDCPVDNGLDALVLATREAVVNAVKFSGAPSVSVYAEVEPKKVTVFVRDRGAGFRLENVLSDRHGIAESIRGRMQRHGGRAEIRSAPGEGTEVELGMPLVAPR